MTVRSTSLSFMNFLSNSECWAVPIPPIPSWTWSNVVKFKTAKDSGAQTQKASKESELARLSRAMARLRVRLT